MFDSAIRIHEIGGPMEGDDALACSRPSLNHQRTMRISPNDSVLIALNRC